MSTTQKPNPLPPPDKVWFDPATGKPLPVFAEWCVSLDRAVRELCGKI